MSQNQIRTRSELFSIDLLSLLFLFDIILREKKINSKKIEVAIKWWVYGLTTKYRLAINDKIPLHMYLFCCLLHATGFGTQAHSISRQFFLSLLIKDVEKVFNFWVIFDENFFQMKILLNFYYMFLQDFICLLFNETFLMKFMMKINFLVQ